MIKEYLIIRTTVMPQLSKHVLMRGFRIAFLGILGLLAGALFFPLPELQTWGWGLFLLSLALITGGLLPYRRLVRLQLKPNELSLLDADQLTFISRGRKKLTVPLKSIEKMSYIDHPLHYGIAIWLKSPAPLPVIVHEPTNEVEKIRQQGRKHENADLFFGYFNRHAYEELNEWIIEEN